MKESMSNMRLRESWASMKSIKPLIKVRTSKIYKILLVNDDSFILSMMNELFEAVPNIEVFKAMNGDQAVKAI